MHYRFIMSMLVLAAFAIISSCKSSGTSTKPVNEEQKTLTTTKTGPAVIVYKTTGKYFDKVPVGLSPDKSKVISFPGPKDIFYKGDFAYPTMLENGYLLDNRGIDENSAFLKFTYEEYSSLEKTPSSEELFDAILDNDPFTEMYFGGSRLDYKEIEKELNDTISRGDLKTLKRLK